MMKEGRGLYARRQHTALRIHKIVTYKALSTEKALRIDSSDSPRQICASRLTKCSKILSQEDADQGMI